VDEPKQGPAGWVLVVLVLLFSLLMLAALRVKI
jgi:hypothetical protein